MHNNMKKLITLFTVLFISAHSYSQIQEVNIDEGYILYKTAKEGEIEVPFYLRDTEPFQVVMDNLLAMLNYTNSSTQMMMKSRRSFVPLSYTYKVKPNKSGNPKKQKYSVWLNYEGSNSFGGTVEDIEMIEFNSKLRETAGSVLMRTSTN